MKRVAICCFVMLFALQSCERKLEIDYKPLFEEASIKLNSERFVLVIPQNGCSNCVKKSYDFMLPRYNSPLIKYVFTNYGSKKGIRVRLKVLGEEDTSEIGFIELSVALDHELSHMYPSLLEIGKDGKAKVTFMNAEDGSDWQWLEEQME
ncbi:hypothetical protein OB69_12305 [Roseivirga seohaensis subsp. aquiponti]|uniref:Uncharacterized protein n=1 Tax=Roseivirga seohaensis subsp. aquiponti TaxID=1566026 RepID=A0A0L8AJN2_9BACT|nr:hypothetical protein [Roseivirga seohaensis]KOF02390.1 hypothetical protein OB69_12305 [Roseivirga seohaensis subsp. aquiponti]